MSDPDLDWLRTTAPRDVTVLIGAGVSVEGPSSLPSGGELTARVFDAYFEPGTLFEVLSGHDDLGWTRVSPCPLDPRTGLVDLRPPGPRLPRLETVLGVVGRWHGEKSVDLTVSDMAGAEPNRLHHFLAQHLGHGGGHLTANFDECVETAAAERGIRIASGDLLHFHESIGVDGARLGATLDRVEQGFGPELAAEFLDLLRSRPVVLVLGYSGSDFFDVDVVVRDLGVGELTGTRVLWVEHGSHAPHPLVDEDRLPPLVHALRRAGAEVDVLCCPTEVPLAVLAAEWGFDPLGDAEARDPRPPALTVDDDLRAVTSMALYLELGMFKHVLERVAAPPAKASADLVRAATSAALWEQGRYNDLRRFWTRVEPTSEADRVRRRERIGACLWVQGRLVPAYLWLTWFRRRAIGEAMRVLAETEGRVLEHMLRTPDLAWFGRRATPRLVQTLGDPDQTAGIHVFRTRSDLKSSLENVVSGTARDGHAATSSEWFRQGGSLLAWVTYRHRMLRDTYVDGVETATIRADYRRLQQHYEALGSSAGATRTHLLPGSQRVFSVREVVSGLMKVQFGPWHRIRILGLHLRARLSDLRAGR